MKQGWILLAICCQLGVAAQTDQPGADSARTGAEDPMLLETPSPRFPLVCIDSAWSGISPCEPSIAINPYNPTLLSAGSVLNRVYHSADSGKTWEVNELSSPLGVWGDPVLVAGDSAEFYYFHLSDPTGKNWSSQEILDRIVCQRSGDGGAHYETVGYAGHRPPKDQDKHWVAYDAHRHTLHLTWTEFDRYNSSDTADRSRILYSASADSGKTWTEPQVLSGEEGDCLDGDGTTEGAVPAMGPEGQVYVAWGYDEKIWFDRSLDGGISWLKQDSIISQQPGGWDLEVSGINRSNGMPVTACDRSSGPHRGRVYVGWVDHRRESYDAWLIFSDDQGLSWSSPQLIGDDFPNSDQFFLWLDVDPATGYLFAVYYNREGLMGDATHTTLAVSEDGGRSFQTLQLTERPFTPNENAFFGDYNHIAAYNGMVRPIWTEMVGKRKSVWTALVQWKTQKP